MNTHELKILPRWFEDVLTGKKNFEIRRNDRDFKVGDYLLLKEYEPAIAKFSGREILKRIQYIYEGDGTYGLSEEFCVLGLETYKCCPKNYRECPHKTFDSDSSQEFICDLYGHPVYPV